MQMERFLIEFLMNFLDFVFTVIRKEMISVKVFFLIQNLIENLYD